MSPYSVNASVPLVLGGGDATLQSLIRYSRRLYTCFFFLESLLVGFDDVYEKSERR